MADEEISEEQFVRWVRAPGVFDVLRPSLGDNDTVRETVLLHVGVGRLRAVAGEKHWKASNGLQSAVLVPCKPAWLTESDAKISWSQFWQTSDLSTKEVLDPHRSTTRPITLIDVRFDPDVLHSIANPRGTQGPPAHSPARKRSSTSPKLVLDDGGITPGQPSASPPAKAEIIRSAGGRPPKPYWEELLIEMARQLYVGDLTPNNQATIERSMHDWLIQHGHKGSETVVRERARALFKALTREVGN